MTTAAHLNSVNTGTSANDGTGSTIKEAFDIVNTNTDKLNQQLNGTADQSAAYPVTFLTASNDISANNGSVYGLNVYGGIVFSRGSEVLTSSTGSWNGGNVTQRVIFSNSIVSTSTTTGAFQVWGGIGIQGNINVGGNTNTISGSLAAGNTSVGTFSASGLATVGSLIVAGASTFIGNVTLANVTETGTTVANVLIANIVAGNGALVTNINANAITTGTISQARLTGAYSGITGLGTLTGLNVGGLIVGQGLYDNANRAVVTTSGAGNLTITGNSISLTTTGPGVATTGSSTAIPVITTDAYGRISAISTASVSSTLNVSGTSGTGSVSLISQSLAFAGTNGVTATASGQTITIGTPQNLQSTATPTFAGATFTSTVVPSANATINLGSTSAWWGTLYGVATQAKYADLAENYRADAEYEPGTVLMFGGSAEVTVADSNTNKVAGVVSTDPAYLMNSHLQSEFVVPLALQGRVPCKVTGTVTRGDMLVSAGCGLAKADPDPKIGTVIGKALADFNGDVGVIEVVVGRL